MSSTLVDAGQVMILERDDVLGSSLKDIGGPSINVMSKVVVMIGLLGIENQNNYFLLSCMISCLLVVAMAIVFKTYQIAKPTAAKYIMQKDASTTAVELESSPKDLTRDP
jgi:hypothetical protein